MKNIDKIAIDQTINTLQMFGIELKNSSKIINSHNDLVNIEIPFVGDINGQFQLNITKQLAIKIANIMLCGMIEVYEIDEMTKSTLGEMCNMISGSISTDLSNRGINTDIRPPIFKDNLFSCNNATVFHSQDKNELLLVSFVS